MEIFSFDDDEPEQEVLTAPPAHAHQQQAVAATRDNDSLGGGNHPRRQGPPQTLDHDGAKNIAPMPTSATRREDVDARHYSFDRRDASMMSAAVNSDAYQTSSYNDHQQARPQFNSYSGGQGYHDDPYSHIDTFSPVMVPGADSYDEQYNEDGFSHSFTADGVDSSLPPSMQMTQDFTTRRPAFGTSPYGFHPTHSHTAQHNNALPVTVPKPIINEPSYPGAPIVSASLPTGSSRFDYAALNDTSRFSPHEDVRWPEIDRQSRSASRRSPPHEDDDGTNTAEMPINSASISPRRDHRHHHGGARRSRRHRRFGSSASGTGGRRRHKDSSSPSSVGSASSGSSASSRSASPEGNISIPRSQSEQQSARSRLGPPLNLADLPRAASLGGHMYPPSTTSYLLQRKADRGPFDARTRTRALQVPSTGSCVTTRSQSVGNARMYVISQRGFDVRPAACGTLALGGAAASGGEPCPFPNVRSPFNPQCKENVHGSLLDSTRNIASVHNNIVSDIGGGLDIGSGARDPTVVPKGGANRAGDAIGDAAGVDIDYHPEEVGDGREGEAVATSDVDYDGGDSEGDCTSTYGDSDSDSDTSADGGHFEFDLRRRRRRKRSVTEQAAAALQDLEINIRVSNSQRHAVVLRFYPWTQVKDVKDTLQRFAEYPPSYLQKLFRGSRELKNTRTLEDSAIVDGSELICCLGVVIDQSAPPIALFGVGNPNDAENQLFSAVSTGLAIGYAPSLAIDGLGGTYFVKDGNGVNVAAFKPQDEEPYCPHNPRGMTGELGSATMRPGFKSGGGMEREYAACLLDTDDWCGVPLTTRAEMCHSAFHSASFTGRGIVSKVGSLQSFVHSDGTAGDFGARTFSAQSVHKIGILDIRMLNVDRNDANILVKRQHDGSLRLVPIDHGYCLPASLSIEWYDWVWYDWPQAKQPFDEDALEFIRSINIDKDLRKLRNDLHIKDECLKLFVLANSLLIKGAAAGLTLFEIATLLMRQTENPSPIEDLMAQCTAFSIREREGRSDAQRAKRCRRASVHASITAARSQTERRPKKRAATCRHGHRHAHQRHYRRHHRRSTIIGGGHVTLGVGRFRGVSHDSATSSCSAASAFDRNDRAQSVPTDSFMENFMLHQFPGRPRGCSHSSSTPLSRSMLSCGGAPRSRSQGTDVDPESQVFSMSPPESITAAGSLAMMSALGGSFGTAVVEFGRGKNPNRASENSFDDSQCADDDMQPMTPLASKFYDCNPGKPNGNCPSVPSKPSALQHGVDLGIFENELRGHGNVPSCFTPRLRALAQQSAALASEAQRRQSMENGDEPQPSKVYTPPQRRPAAGAASSSDISRITPENSKFPPAARGGDASDDVGPPLATRLSSASEKDIEEKEIGGVLGSTTPLIVPTTPMLTPKKKTVGGATSAYVPPSLRRRRAAAAAEKMSMSAPADSYMPTDSIYPEASSGPGAMSIPARTVNRTRANSAASTDCAPADLESEDLAMSPHELGGFQDRPSSCSVGKAILLSDNFHETNVHTHAPHPPRASGTSSPGALSEFIYQKRRTSQMPCASPYKMMTAMEVLPEHCETTPTPPRASSASAGSAGTTTRRSGLSAALHRERSKSERPLPPARARASNLSLALARVSCSPSASPVQSPKRRHASAFTFASSPKASSLSRPGDSPRASTPGRNAGVSLSPCLGTIYPPSHSPTRFTLKSPSRNLGQCSDDDSFISMPQPVMRSQPVQALTPQRPPPVVLPHREHEQMTIVGNKNLLQRRLAHSPSPSQALCDLHRSLSPSFNTTWHDDDVPGQPPQPLFEGTGNHPLAQQGAGTLSPLQTSKAKSANRPPAITIPSPTAMVTPPFTFSPTGGGGFRGFSMPNRSILREMVAPEEEPAPDFVQASGLMNAPEGSLAIVPLRRNASRQSVNRPSSFDLSPMPMCAPAAVDTNIAPQMLTHEKRSTSSASSGSFLSVEPPSEETPKSRRTAVNDDKANSGGRGLGRGRGLARGGGRGIGGVRGGLTRTSSMFLLSDYAKATKDGYASPRKQPTDRRVDSPFDSKNLHSLEVSERQRRKIIRRYVSPLFDAIFMEKANTALDLLVKREAGKKLKKQMQDQPHTAPSSIHGGSPATTTLTSGPLSSSFPDSGLFSLTPPALSTHSSLATTQTTAASASSRAYVPPQKRFDAAQSSSTSGGAYVPPHKRRAADGTTDAMMGGGLTASSSLLLAVPRSHRGISSESFHSSASSNASRRAVMGPPVPTDLYDDIIFTDDIGDMSEYFEED